MSDVDMRLRATLGAVVFLVGAGAGGCRDEGGMGVEGENLMEGADTEATMDEPPVPPEEPGSGYELPLPEPVEPDDECEPGTYEPCECDDMGSGLRMCLPNGRFSGCGCTSDDSVYEPPPPPDYEYCGDTACPPYLFPASDYSATHCCTEQGACGSTNDNLFGANSGICLERGAERGARSPDCPDESIPFVDMLGCCLPSGQCGMSIDETFPNWDVGCIERTQWKPMLDGLTPRFFAAILFGFDPSVPDWEPLACTPAED